MAPKSAAVEASGVSGSCGSHVDQGPQADANAEDDVPLSFEDLDDSQYDLSQDQEAPS